LLAPRAWRYAVPALALLLISAVALIVFMRTRPYETSIAQRNTSERAKAAPVQTEQHHTTQPNNTATTATVDEGAGTTPNSNAPASSSSKEETAAAAVAREEQAQARPGIVLSDEAPPLPAPAPATGSGAAARAVTEMAAPTPAPPAAEPVIVTQESEAKVKAVESVGQLAKDTQQRQADFENLQREQAANARRAEKLSGPRRNNEQMRNSRAMNTGDARNRGDRPDESTAATTVAPAPAAIAKRARQRDADRERDEAKPSDSSLKSEGRRAPEATGETRTVGGRRFRRQGGAWVDTAYSAGQSYTVVRRNSEQYRALVADEPAIGRIGDALGGEVTVVWKGRAYRIR
ncbi:MAG TPA: hypothetical protein VER76_02390, partial [Pyrinomonadaceae bacterium]|nr:hypothetical protein [Pyrinomonadaceae bacterium]